MAGHISAEESSIEVEVEETPGDNGNIHSAYTTHHDPGIASHTLFHNSVSSANTIQFAQLAVITPRPRALELRQNNAADCNNLITAAVDRATVEISRTIIRLNATFSQQIFELSKSSSAGISSANSSAISTVNFVVRSASVVSSSAAANVTSAQIALTSATISLSSALSALTSLSAASSSLSTSLGAQLANLSSASNSLLSASSSDVLRLSSASSSISLASSSDVSRLSSSLADLQARLVRPTMDCLSFVIH